MTTKHKEGMFVNGISLLKVKSFCIYKCKRVYPFVIDETRIEVGHKDV
ncbi:MAG: hypothetical protein MUO21_06400 [Nitrososphaeraceae archaeon]|nr:hypothetical protein [Nitrososphaeraceae archaeon]